MDLNNATDQMDLTDISQNILPNGSIQNTTKNGSHVMSESTPQEICDDYYHTISRPNTMKLVIRGRKKTEKIFKISGN